MKLRFSFAIAEKRTDLHERLPMDVTVFAPSIESAYEKVDQIFGKTLEYVEIKYITEIEEN